MGERRPVHFDMIRLDALTEDKSLAFAFVTNVLTTNGQRHLLECVYGGFIPENDWLFSSPPLHNHVEEFNLTENTREKILSNRIFPPNDLQEDNERN